MPEIHPIYPARTFVFLTGDHVLQHRNFVDLLGVCGGGGRFFSWSFLSERWWWNEVRKTAKATVCCSTQRKARSGFNSERFETFRKLTRSFLVSNSNSVSRILKGSSLLHKMFNHLAYTAGMWWFRFGLKVRFFFLVAIQHPLSTGQTTTHCTPPRSQNNDEMKRKKAFGRKSVEKKKRLRLTS